jgi:hypothetical protein
MGKDRFLPIVALCVLAIASISSIYVYTTQASINTLTINGQHYTIDQLFTITKQRTFADLNSSGIALEDLMIQAGVNKPESRTYTIIGSDGYQKTVTWENLGNGLLTRNRTTIFRDLPKAFWVKDVVAIEVK